VKETCVDSIYIYVGCKEYMGSDEARYTTHRYVMLISDVYIYIIYINYTISGEACARYAIGRTQGALKYTAR
jgi:hypothetical protein